MSNQKSKGNLKVTGNNQKVNRKRRKTGMLTVSAVVLVLCAAMLIGSYQLSNKIHEYDAVEQNLLAQIEEQKQESAQLDKESEYVKTEDYIEQIARDKLGLVKKNEIIFKKESN